LDTFTSSPNFSGKGKGPGTKPSPPLVGAEMTSVPPLAVLQSNDNACLLLPKEKADRVKDEVAAAATPGVLPAVGCYGALKG
jgi:hypothetical protein